MNGVLDMDNELLREFYNNAMEYLPKIPTVIIVLAAGTLLINFFKRLTVKIMERLRLDKAIIGFVQAFITFACWVFLIAVVFAVMGFPQISIAFSGSIALILVGIATNANSMIQDILAGIFLIADPDFVVGAKVTVNNVSGIVTSLDIKKTKIRDANDHIHVISNKVFDSSIYIIEPDHPSES